VRSAVVSIGRSELRYRPYLDGVRCLAVYLVLAFHAGLGAFPGGFVGVDVFFVLSGYLVTGILLRDLAKLGRVELRRFYARRVRRMRWWALRLTIGTAALASAVAAIHIATTNVDRAYYGTDTRAYQLLAGAFLAVTPQLFRLGERARPAARWVAAFVLAALV